MAEHDHVAAAGTGAVFRPGLVRPDQHIAFHPEGLSGTGNGQPQGPWIAPQLNQDGQNQPFADNHLFDIDNVRVVLGK